MSVRTEKIEKLMTIARLYYEDNKNQNEIAKLLGISRPLVSRYLAEAKEIGVVRIEIKSPIEEEKLILDRMQQRFGILGGCVVTNRINEADTNREIAETVIDGLTQLSSGTAVGIGWGSIIGVMTRQLRKHLPIDKKNNIYPLVGNSGVFNRDYHPGEIISVFAEKTGGQPQYWSAPAFVDSMEEKKALKEQSAYRKMESGWKSMKVAFVNVGNYPSVPDFATAASYGTRLTEKKAVGKLLCYYYDINGHIIKPDMDCTMQIPLEILSKRKFVVGVCGANVHPKALEGALKTGILTHIVASRDTLLQIED